MTLRVLSWLLLCAVLSFRCGVGGIVDNGNKPPTDPEPKPDDRRPPAHGAPSIMVGPTLVVLNEYAVTNPDRQWTAVGDDKKTILTKDSRTITFIFGQSGCEAPEESTTRGQKLRWCGPHHAILEYSSGDQVTYVMAQFGQRDAEIDTILRSFGSKYR